MAASGRFITVEGGEGVGKSRFTTGLAQALRAGLASGRWVGAELLTTREPGGTPVADQIRGIFGAPPGGERLAMETEALLVSAARAQHVARVIRPALARGAWVLSDRYADSMRVYQGALGGVSRDDVEALIKFSTGGLEPDLTFLLDCDVELALSRLAKRPGGKPDDVARYDQEQVSFHQKLRRAYLELAAREPRRIVRLAADCEPERMVENALDTVEARFGQR